MSHGRVGVLAAITIAVVLAGCGGKGLSQSARIASEIRALTRGEHLAAPAWERIVVSEVHPGPISPPRRMAPQAAFSVDGTATLNVVPAASQSGVRANQQLLLPPGGKTVRTSVRINATLPERTAGLGA